ncbi:MAG TPA: hypothetical protein VJ810_34905 [Blastocatellia bacterium]|nr:hypothetical protein [Blastocatellia bacterium]
MISVIRVAILVGFPAFFVSPVDARPLPQDDVFRASFELLLKADAVYDRAIGDKGIRPEEYKAFETLWRAGKEGKDYALKLVRAEAPAARVYGAILLRELAKEAAEQEFPRMEEEITTVWIHFGCERDPATIGDIVRLLKMGGFVIMTPTGKWSSKKIDRTLKEMGVRRKVFNIPLTKRSVKR